MAYSPDKEYQAAQVYAARQIVSRIQQEVIVLQEAQFFVDTDTVRDLIDPQGAAACLHYLRGEDVPTELMSDPNVAGLLDEFDLMSSLPTAKLAVVTLFRSDAFRGMLQEAIENLQREFGETAGDTPPNLQRYFEGAITV